MYKYNFFQFDLFQNEKKRLSKCSLLHIYICALMQDNVLINDLFNHLHKK